MPKTGLLSEETEKVKVIPITNPGKDATDPSKFRPICLINVGGKGLEKTLHNYAPRAHQQSPESYLIWIHSHERYNRRCNDGERVHRRAAKRVNHNTC